MAVPCIQPRRNLSRAAMKYSVATFACRIRSPKAGMRRRTPARRAPAPGEVGEHRPEEHHRDEVVTAVRDEVVAVVQRDQPNPRRDRGDARPIPEGEREDREHAAGVDEGDACRAGRQVEQAPGAPRPGNAAREDAVVGQEGAEIARQIQQIVQDRQSRRDAKKR